MGVTSIAGGAHYAQTPLASVLVVRLPRPLEGKGVTPNCSSL